MRLSIAKQRSHGATHFLQALQASKEKKKNAKEDVEGGGKNKESAITAETEQRT
jgi:hypothetical protein